MASGLLLFLKSVALAERGVTTAFGLESQEKIRHMKTLFAEKKARGLTLVEVLLVLSILAILAVFVSPLFPSPRHVPRRATRARCMNNLRQIYVSFQLWGGEHDWKLPMQISITNGGTRELIADGAAYPHFLAISDYLNNPEVLFCPSEMSSARRTATTFSTAVTRGYPTPVPFTGDTNVSYFVGLDADSLYPQTVLSGDRNLTVNGVALSPGLHSFRTNDLVGWSGEMHKNQGNVIFVDGSAMTSSGSPGLFGTNRAAIP